jgi:YopX protein
MINYHKIIGRVKMRNSRYKFRAWWKDREGKAEELINDINDRPISDLNESHLIIEQYTGLKDKNGKEIYEGDILENDNGPKSEVVFWDGAFCLDFGNGLNHFNSLTNFAPGIAKAVIGNIHENPELLK